MLGLFKFGGTSLPHWQNNLYKFEISQ